MNFLLTTFFQELSEPVMLVASRGLVLDNARTDEELEHVTMLLTRAASMDGVHVSMLPGIAIHVPWPAGLATVRTRTLDSVVDDQIPAEAALALMEEVARAAAPQQIICRFDDGGAYDELQEIRGSVPAKSVVLLSDDNPLLTRSREAFEIGQLLALLACDEDTEGTLGDAFILDHTPDWSTELGEKLAAALVTRCLISVDKRGQTGFKFADFEYYSARLATVGRRFDDRLSSSEATDPLLYAGQLMAIAAETRDSRTRLVNLVALLELLLTRKPDSSRFNVEDSLTKQFVLKLGVLLYCESPTLDLNWTRRALMDLYALRSAIAHGDFGRLDGLLTKSSFAESESSLKGASPTAIALDGACEFAYRCVRCAVGASLQHPPLVEFLKRS